MIRLVTLPLAVAAVLLLATGALAQEDPPPSGSDSSTVMGARAPEPEPPAQMEGYVIAMPSGQRLPGSLVMLRSGERYKTDLEGRFQFPGLRPGLQEVMIVTPGCQVSFTEVTLEPWQTRRIGFTVNWSLDVQAAEARRRSSEGELVTAEDIDVMQVRYLSDVIRRMAPEMVGGGTTGADASSLRGRGFSSAQGAGTPILVIDGVRAAEASTRTIDEIAPDAVAYIEIIKGAAGGWEFGSEGASGVIRITTKSGTETDAPRIPPELCSIPDWPERG